MSTLDIAGTAWPVFKLEALAIGLVVLLVVLAVVGSAQIAVLAASALGAARWIAALSRRPQPSD